MAVNGSGIPVAHPAAGLPAAVRADARVGVIVIGYDDAAHIGHAVRSALGQGPAVAEVVAVDDASTDGTGALLDRLAAREPRLRVVHRAVNSGGCGTPRNDGLRATTAPYVMFLDSDDILPRDAVTALLRGALAHDAPVTAGLCVRRELPRRRDTPWQPALYRRPAVHASPEKHPALLRDTLCVNKLYSRDFLTAHGIDFPEGPFPYEDFVFSARVLAAGPRVAVVPDPVYVWHVRRGAARPSISLDRERVANWQARVRAHERGVEVFRDAGNEPLAHAARVKFLDHDLRMYVRELPGHGPAYRAAWWRAARAALAACDEADLRAARAPARWIARVVLASETPRDLDRLAQLAARPARLLPPYAEAAGRPIWAADLPQAVLDGLTGPGAKPARRLPVTIDATLRHRPGRGRHAELRLRVHELYGRLAAARPHGVDVELRLRDGDSVLEHTASPQPDEPNVPGGPDGPGRPGGPDAGTSWGVSVPVDLAALAARGLLDARARRALTTGPQSWDVRVRIHCAHGGTLRTAVRAVGAGSRPAVLLGARYGLLLAQPHATASGSLVLRLAPGARCVLGVALRRARTLLSRLPLLRRTAAART
ncbi:glycosyltransferase family 2 protein [Streptomyces hesseae]|uniref:Glycosyltransferase family 2 protein n=1 Tax=Streptomyces hesseae TaxID=3075519 RepID=A0ABU2SY04_9ACTN|nr:glycosyltransferase family 2 protein [Streptomyces sp. DSM 40473]MDT0453700.1 glycosyltransferase family 2 protein [Streptomyces sp. DSM 40473]